MPRSKMSPIKLPSVSTLTPKYLFSQPYRDRPILYIDQCIIDRRYDELKSMVHGATIHYAMKCNPHEQVLRRIKDLGGRFEIASYSELVVLQKIGVDPIDVLFSNPVKSLRDIRFAYKAGVRCFAFQSEDELAKLASVQAVDNEVKVYLRVSTPIGKSTVASESKFGQSIDNENDQREAVRLMKYAKRLKLVAYGLAFHVGSQMESPESWAGPIRNIAGLMHLLRLNNIQISMLDIGGGFPAYHSAHIPALTEFGAVITRELVGLPYQPRRIVLEPGRALVSDAGAMVAEVYGKAYRNGKWWLYLNVGAFNGLMESLETRTQLLFPMADSRNSKTRVPYIVSGPSCDGQDTVAKGQLLSADLVSGDRVIIYTTGAYTTAYASRFNGFQTPLVKFI